MNHGPRLDLRQSQQLVMTPQLQQAIKLLALSNLEIEAFIGEALEANPLLEMGDGAVEEVPADVQAADNGSAESPLDTLIDSQAGATGDQPLDIDPEAIARETDTGDGMGIDGVAKLAGAAAGPAVEERGGGELSLADHLEAQIGAAAPDQRTAFIARYLVGQLDEAGYLVANLRDVANELGAPLAEIESALTLVHSLDPTGVGARSLGECLALQAIDADRHDPCMARLIENLDLVAKGDIKRLKRICEVDDEDFADMLAELRSYDPKPGLRFGPRMADAPVTPDVLVRAVADRGWDIVLNQATLPRLVVNRSYYLRMKGECDDRRARSWLNEKLSDANWLVKALDQRQKTILKVAAELVKQQDGFFRHGVAHLKPLTLREIAGAIEMHESTVSRVTANKYLQCERGTFELKYFFTSGVASAHGEGVVSAAAVKAQIRALVDAEDPANVLSDDALVEALREKGFDLARRTVAKYREAIGIGSSVQRRRQKRLEGVR